MTIKAGLARTWKLLFGTYASTYVTVAVVPLTLMVVANYVIDPLWLYRKPFLYDAFSSDERESNPGLARFADYDSVIIGTSHAVHTRPSSVAREFGWKPLRLTMKGATTYEHHKALGIALKTGRVKHVLWSIDEFSFNKAPDAARDPVEWPGHLYDPTPMTHVRYLISGATFWQGFKLLKNRAQTLDERGFYHHKHEYSEAAALRDWVNEWRMESPVDDFRWDNAHKNIAILDELLTARPDIDFVFCYNPYSVLNHVKVLLKNESFFRDHVRFKRELTEMLLSHGNVRVFDFEDDYAITHDMTRYMDLAHYDPKVNEYMVAAMAKGERELTPANLEPRLAAFVEDAYRTAHAVFADDHPLRDKLELTTYRLAPPKRTADEVIRETCRTMVASGDRKDLH